MIWGLFQGSGCEGVAGPSPNTVISASEPWAAVSGRTRVFKSSVSSGWAFLDGPASRPAPGFWLCFSPGCTRETVVDG